MRTGRFVLGVLVGVVISAVTLAAIFAWQALRPVAKLPQKASLPAGDITITVQEGYLSQVITGLARKEEPMIQDVVADVQPGARVDMILGLQMQMLGQALDVQVRLINTMQVVDARLRFDMQRIELAGLEIPLDMLPQSMRATMQTTLADANEQANRMLAENGLVPLSITTNDSSITVSLGAR